MGLNFSIKTLENFQGKLDIFSPPFVFMQLECLLCSWYHFLAVFRTNSHGTIFPSIILWVSKTKEEKILCRQWRKLTSPAGVPSFRGDCVSTGISLFTPVPYKDLFLYLYLGQVCVAPPLATVTGHEEKNERIKFAHGRNLPTYALIYMRLTGSFMNLQLFWSCKFWDCEIMRYSRNRVKPTKKTCRSSHVGQNLRPAPHSW